MKRKRKKSYVTIVNEKTKERTRIPWARARGKTVHWAMIEVDLPPCGRMRASISMNGKNVPTSTHLEPGCVIKHFCI